MPYQRTILLLLLQSVLGTAAAPPLPTPPHYTVTDLGTLPGGSHSAAYGINNAGEIVGWSDSGSNDVEGYDRKVYIHNHAVLWEKGRLYDLGLVKSFPFTAAKAINAKGQVAASWELQYQPGIGGGPMALFQSFLWQQGRRTILGMETATAINNKGQIVGQSGAPNQSQRHPFLWAKGKTFDLGLLPGATEGIANGINDSGEIVGWVEGEASNKQNGDYRAFLCKNGHMTNLNPVPIGTGDYNQNFSQAWAINNKEQIVGVHEGEATQWQHGQRRFLGSLPGDYESIAYAINNNGVAVGQADNGDLKSQACLFQSGSVCDLNTFIPAASGWVLSSARGINDNGQIVGYGQHNGQSHAFLLTPTKKAP